VVAISVIVLDAVLAAGMNDSGTGADRFASDGLWTGRITLGSPIPDGKYKVDFLPWTSAPALGDSYPRLRHHN
jgi:hypothetical protein